MGWNSGRIKKSAKHHDKAHLDQSINLERENLIYSFHAVARKITQLLLGARNQVALGPEEVTSCDFAD